MGETSIAMLGYWQVVILGLGTTSFSLWEGQTG